PDDSPGAVRRLPGPWIVLLTKKNRLEGDPRPEPWDPPSDGYGETDRPHLSIDEGGGGKRRREGDVFQRLEVEEIVCPHTQKDATRVPVHKERSRSQKVKIVEGDTRNQGNEDGTKGPMIIKAQIGGHFIQRMYVDKGSASEILYELLQQAPSEGKKTNGSSHGAPRRFQWRNHMANVNRGRHVPRLQELRTLTAPMEKEELIVYLAAAREAYIQRALVIGQILADFIVECLEDDPQDAPMEAEEELLDLWILFTNGSSCVDSFRAGLILINLKGPKFTYAMRFRFDTTNNEAEYEALIAGLIIADQMGIKTFKQMRIQD
nr:reverse transcriptase domain-containing protein [Tanacetum cinerariifolium]